MAKGNVENLMPVTSKEEARELGRKGGKASGVARREKKTIRKSLELLLERVQEGEELTGAESVAAALFYKALSGDVRAIEVLRDSVGEKPTDKVEHQGRMDLVATLEEARKRAASKAIKIKR